MHWGIGGIDRSDELRAALEVIRAECPREGTIAMCHGMGWVVGDRLVGDEGYGPTVIEIDYIGDETFLASTIVEGVREVGSKERNWTLWCRDWKLVPRPYLEVKDDD